MLIRRVTDAVIWDGGITDYREAAYPFYRLCFGDCSMAITAKNSLLVMMNETNCYEYGIGRRGAPVNQNSMNYLLNAERLRFRGEYASNGFYSEEEQINKTVRALKCAAVILLIL